MADLHADFAIVGGGAAGLAAAITAARLLRERRSLRIVVLERLDRVGKKLLATGNGRCNLTHAGAGIESFHGRDPRFALGALRRFDCDDTVAFFRELGMLCRTESDGRVFPYSLQSNTVLDTLRHAATRLGVELRTGFEVARIEPARPLYIGNSPLSEATGFDLFATNGDRMAARRVLVATGGCASPALGSNGSGYDLLQALGHQLVPVNPAIVHITTETTIVKPLSGVKVQGKARLFEGTREIAADDGEILFTDDGLSGPPILQLSRLVSTKAPEAEHHLVLDLMPDYSEAEIAALLAEFAPAKAGLPFGDLLNGFLPKKLAATVMRLALDRPLTEPAAPLGKADRQLIAAMVKNLPIRVTGTRGFQFAQATAGGIATTGFRPDTLESCLVPGLYAAGEVLDIDGDCGGYNLQWAWSSGVLAATRAAASLINDVERIAAGGRAPSSKRRKPKPATGMPAHPATHPATGMPAHPATGTPVHPANLRDTGRKRR